MSRASPTTGTHLPTTPPRTLEVAKGFNSVGAQVASIVCGNTARKNCDATEVPGVKLPILVPVERMLEPAANKPAPAPAVPADPVAHVFRAFRSFCEFCCSVPLFGATELPPRIACRYCSLSRVLRRTTPQHDLSGAYSNKDRSQRKDNRGDSQTASETHPHIPIAGEQFQCPPQKIQRS